MSFIFLDFDKTIIHGDAGPMFGNWMFHRRRHRVSEKHRRPVAAARKAVMWGRVIPFVSWMGVQAALYRARAVRRSTVVRNAYKGLKGVPVAQLDELMEEFVEDHVAPLIYPQIRQEMQEALDAGRRCVIITTGMERLVEKCLPYLPDGVELVGCRLEEKNGRLTGGIISGPLYGADKANIVLAHCRAAGVDPADCHAYTDHYSDHQMLDAVGRGTCINPARRLREMAAKKDWRVLDLPDPTKEEREEEVQVA